MNKDKHKNLEESDTNSEIPEISRNNRVELTFEGITIEYWAEKLHLWCIDLLDSLGMKSWDLSILFCDDDLIKDLNLKYRGKEEATDVLSFSQNEWYMENGENRFLAGDVIISMPSLIKNTKEFKVDRNDEIKRLVLHGILHLAGMDHETNDPEEPMLAMQEKILAQFMEVSIF